LEDAYIVARYLLRRYEKIELAKFVKEMFKSFVDRI